METNQPKTKKIAFTVTDEQYQALVKLSKDNKRKTADLVRVTLLKVLDIAY